MKKVIISILILVAFSFGGLYPSLLLASSSQKVELKLSMQIPEKAGTAYLGSGEYHVWKMNEKYYAVKTKTLKYEAPVHDGVLIIDGEYFTINESIEKAQRYFQIAPVTINKKYFNLSGNNIYLADLLRHIEQEIRNTKEEFLTHRLETSRRWKKIANNPEKINDRFEKSIIDILDTLAADTITNPTVEFMLDWTPNSFVRLSVSWPALDKQRNEKLMLIGEQYDLFLEKKNLDEEKKNLDEEKKNLDEKIKIKQEIYDGLTNILKKLGRSE